MRFHYLAKQIFFLIKPHQEQEQQTLLRPWLITISQNTSGKTQLFPPLIHDGPIPFTQVINFNKFSVLHLGSSYIRDAYDDTFHSNVNYIGPDKVVAITCHGKRLLVLGTLFCVPQPILLKCRNDENWKIIPDDMSIDFIMGDICLFKGQPYATNKFGKTIMVGLDDDSSVQLVAEPLVDGGDMKFLVESEGDLLLVDFYECIRTGFPDHDPVRIDVFKLNEKEKKWVKLTSLGDRVFFLTLYAHFLHLLQICVFPKEIVLSLWIISSHQIYTMDKIHVFCTWIKVEFHLCLILLNFPTCSSHLLSGSSKAEFVSEYVILHWKVFDVIVL